MKIIYFLLFFLIFTNIASAYEVNQCELIMRDYQKEHGGSFVFIQPLKSNSAYDLGQYNGHWINKLPDGSFYDAGRGQSFETIEDIKNGYEGNEVVFDMELNKPPFRLIYHYRDTKVYKNNNKLSVIKR